MKLTCGFGWEANGLGSNSISIANEYNSSNEVVGSLYPHACIMQTCRVFLELPMAGDMLAAWEFKHMICVPEPHRLQAIFLVVPEDLHFMACKVYESLTYSHCTWCSYQEALRLRAEYVLLSTCAMWWLWRRWLDWGIIGGKLGRRWPDSKPCLNLSRSYRCKAIKSRKWIALCYSSLDGL